MPVYDYRCKCGEVTEARQGYDDTVLPCLACGAPAQRVAVYQFQYTITETGGNSYPRLNNAKRTDGKYRVADFQEASATISDAYERVEKKEGAKIKSPNPYKTGLRKAAKMGAKIK